VVSGAEAVLGFYEDNLESLLAAAQAAGRLQEAGVAGFAGWEGLEEQLTRLNEGGTRKGNGWSGWQRAWVCA